MNPDRSNNLSLKYQTFTPSGCKDIGIRKFEFVAKTQFLYEEFIILSRTYAIFKILTEKLILKRFSFEKL